VGIDDGERELEVDRLSGEKSHYTFYVNRGVISHPTLQVGCCPLFLAGETRPQIDF